jgi:hypothetical protein
MLWSCVNLRLLRPIFRAVPLLALLFCAVPLLAQREQGTGNREQDTSNPQNPTPNTETPIQTPNDPTTQRPNDPPSPNAERPTPDVPDSGALNFEGVDVRINQATGEVSAEQGIVIEYRGTRITAERARGNFNSEIVFTGNAKIADRDIVSFADAIHFFPTRRTYRLDNPRAIIQPNFFRQRIDDPVFVEGGTFAGARNGYTTAEECEATTCTEPTHRHYYLRFRSAELVPGRQLTLKRVAVYFFGTRLVVLPSLTIPLDNRQRRRIRTDYLPEFGRNVFEGYFARFPYAFAIGAAAAAFLRTDFTEKQGIGYRIEQQYLAGKQESQFNTSNQFGGGAGAFGGGFSAGGYGGSSEGAITQAFGYGSIGSRLPRFGTGLGPNNGGLLTLQGNFQDGFGRNFEGSYRHQQYIGSNNRVALNTELRNNSFLGYTAQRNWNTRLNFNHSDAAHGVSADAVLNYITNSSGTSSTNQITGTYRHTWEFDTAGANRNTLSFNADGSRYVSGTAGNLNRSMRINPQFEFRHFARDYSYVVNANKSFAIGPQTGGSDFGTLERLPELQVSMDTYNFKGGAFKRIPGRFEFGVGRYSEPSTNTQTERVLLNLAVNETPLLSTKRTEIVSGGGFEQRVYGDGAAQYILRNTSRLRQRFGNRSGFDINYLYQQPAGGTSFQFDQFGRSHSLTAEAGYLDDRHFQLTARVGYDLLGVSRERPWQSLSTRLMWRPSDYTRYDALATFDPNDGKFFSFTQFLRLRGRNDFALDLNARYDPTTGKFAQVAGQFDIPFSRKWRVSGLVRYNGLNGRLESTNVQIAHRWDCMEATLTYTDTPLGFRNDRQLFLAIRLTAFPFFRSFARGPAGDVLNAGLGDIY